MTEQKYPNGNEESRNKTINTNIQNYVKLCNNNIEILKIPGNTYLGVVG